MKRLLKGFTLAEVLITLGIIGVIASVTLPTITANVQRQQVGPALAKAINSLETANKMVLQNAGVRTLPRALPEGEVANSTSYFSQILSQVIPFSRSNNIQPYKNFNSSEVFNVGVPAFTSKDGISYFVLNNSTTSTAGITQATDTNPNLGGSFYSVWIDINGNSKKPNMRGKDFFHVLVDTKGTVFATGSDAARNYTTTGTGSWRTNCQEKKIPTNATACGGSIVDNGYKVVYNY